MSGDERDDPGILVGRVGRAHGIKGDVSLDVRTDAPELRFAAGAVLDTVRGPLTVQSSVWHSGRLLVRFAGVADRTGAEDLRGVELRIPTEQRGEAGTDAWWDEDLIGLQVLAPDGAPLGVVADVVHAMQDLLAITTEDGREVLVPFVAAIVPRVEVARGRLVVDPPAGLFDPA